MVRAVRVKGLRETIRASRLAEKEAGRAMRRSLSRAGDVVQVEWSRRFSKVDEGSASGFRTKVSARGVRVVQSRRKKTSRRPDYGAMQMRYGLGVLFDKEREIVSETEEAFDEIGDRFVRR